MITAHNGRTIKMKDGRTLGYAEYGVPDGNPVFYFHGNPSSRLEGRRMDKPAQELKARIVAIDRPGIGLSDFKAGRRYLDWPDDVTELADNLGIERFAVLGASNGGPYAMVCAYKIPRRLTAVTLVSSPCPFDVSSVIKDFSRFQRFSVFVVRRAPWLATIRLRMLVRKVHQDPAVFISQVNGQIADVDRAVLESKIIGDPQEMDRVISSLQQAFRLGVRGVVWDYFLLVNPWDFHPEDISVSVKLWHGEADETVPASMGRYLASSIPDCRANFIPGEGHYMITNHTREILGDLLT